MVPGDTAAHTTPVDSCLFVCLILLTIVVVIAADRVLLGLLLLLLLSGVIDLLLESTCLGLGTRDFLLFLAFLQLFPLCLDLQVCVVIQIHV